MIKFKGTPVKINKLGSLAHGKNGKIYDWDSKIKKYEVTFHGGWCGWFKLKELIFNKKD